MTKGYDPFAAPEELGAAGAQMWADLIAVYDVLSEPAGLVVLRQLCEAHDTIHRLNLEIKTYGEVVETEAGAPKVNPAVKQRLDLHQFIARQIAQLNLLTPPKRPRPGRPTLAEEYIEH